MAAPVFVTDDVPTADQVNTWMVNMNFAYKTADEPIASSTTFQDDNHLTLPVVVSATYQVKMLILATGTTSQNIQWRLNGPSGATLQAATIGTTAGSPSAGNGLSPRIDLVTLGSSEQHGLYGTGTITPIWTEGVLVTGGAAGAFNLQWAQATSGGTATNVKVGSFLRLTRVL